MTIPSDDLHREILFEKISALDPDMLLQYQSPLTSGGVTSLTWSIRSRFIPDFVFGQNPYNILTPLYWTWNNMVKYQQKTGLTSGALKKHFIYHWATDFEFLHTYEQIKEAILNAETGASFATTIAVNKYIRQNTRTEKEIKLLLQGSPWRWTSENGWYFQKTFYEFNNLAGILSMVDENHIFFGDNGDITSLISFEDYITERLQQVRYEIEEEEETPDEEEPQIPGRQELMGHGERATDHFRFKSSPKKVHTTFLGVELELEGFTTQEFKTLNTLKKHAIFKRDGSLNHGVEICTAPATLDIHVKEFTDFFEQIKKDNSKLHAETTCGLHIHIDKSKISKLHLATLYLFINNDENQQKISALAGRKPNNYCELHKVGYEYFTDPSQHKTKYRQINLVPSNTIELRLFASTINKDDFCKRLEFAQAMVDYTRPGEVNHSIKEVPKWENFTNYLKTKQKLYPHLVQYLHPTTKKAKTHATIQTRR